MAGSSHENHDLPYTTKREAGCFFLLFLIPLKLTVIYFWVKFVINSPTVNVPVFFLFALVSGLLSIPISYSCSLWKYEYEPFKKQE